MYGVLDPRPHREKSERLLPGDEAHGAESRTDDNAVVIDHQGGASAQADDPGNDGHREKEQSRAQRTESQGDHR